MRQVCNFVPVVVSVCSAPGTSHGLRQTSRANSQRGPNAETLQPLWEPEATLRAGTLNGRLGTEMADNKITGETALWLCWSQPAHCGQFLFLLLGKRSGSPLNGIYIFVLCSANDCQAPFGPGVQIFPLVFRRMCWKLPAECMVVPKSNLPKNCGSLQMLWPWKFLAKTPQPCFNSSVTGIAYYLMS